MNRQLPVMRIAVAFLLGGVLSDACAAQDAVAGGNDTSDTKVINIKSFVPEDEDRYPEQYFFGVLPSWGAYIRHAKNIAFVNVELKAWTPAARKKICLEDVEGFVER